MLDKNQKGNTYVIYSRKLSIIQSHNTIWKMKNLTLSVWISNVILFHIHKYMLRSGLPFSTSIMSITVYHLSMIRFSNRPFDNLRHEYWIKIEKESSLLSKMPTLHNLFYFLGLKKNYSFFCSLPVRASKLRGNYTILEKKNFN